MQSRDEADLRRRLPALRTFQALVAEPVRDIRTETPLAALEDLESAASRAPSSYRSYLEEALGCYRHHLYRAAVLMTWAATMSHLYEIASAHKGGVRVLENANVARFSNSKQYREIRNANDFLYLKEAQFILLAEDAGMYNRDVRKLLEARLDTRNSCGHPTGRLVGREEAVVFIESLCINVLSGHQLNW